MGERANLPARQEEGGEEGRDVAAGMRTGTRNDVAEGGISRVCVLCVGNKLMLDDGVGPAVYDEIMERYEIPEGVDFFDVGCMSMDMIGWVDEYDSFISVDAADGTGEEPGTVFRYEPDDIARNVGPVSSLHEMKLADLFDAAALLGYEARGICYGMQVDNMYPAEFTVGLTPAVHARLDYLVECVRAELSRQGFELVPKRA